MALKDYLDIHPDVAQALAEGRPVVALESTIISHGLPWPQNLEVARDLEAVIREEGAVPATVGIVKGRIVVGLSDDQIVEFAQNSNVVKVSRRDLATVVALKQDGATTVASTMICAAMAGIRLFATGGIGGVHRGAEVSMDISADLVELSRTQVAVVCSGAKSILDLPKTLEFLETNGVPVLGYQTADFPAFHSRESGLSVDQKVDDVDAVALILKTREDLQMGAGEVIANPIPEADEIAKPVIDGWIATALQEAEEQNVRGKDATPFLLSRLAELSEGVSVAANLALVKNNARIAARIAKAYCAG